MGRDMTSYDDDVIEMVCFVGRNTIVQIRYCTIVELVIWGFGLGTVL